MHFSAFHCHSNVDVKSDICWQFFSVTFVHNLTFSPLCVDSGMTCNWIMFTPSLPPLSLSLSLSDPSLTPENLSTVLDLMSDRLWRRFGGYVNIPGSERDRIEEQCSSARECKQVLIDFFLSSHPAPSWTLVASALYRIGGGYGEDSCLRALDLLQQLFPTGNNKLY